MTGMAKMLLLGIVALVAGTACGQTAHDQTRPMAAGGAAAGGALGGGGGEVAGTSGGGGNGGAGQVAGAGGAGGNGGAGQVAGAGGAGGGGGTSPLLSAVAECENYCGTLKYLLPSALCEDWNRPGWNPEFCGVDVGMSCADYCGHVYETISTACAAALPAAIRCVAPTYATGIIPMFNCWLQDCRNQLFTMTSACYGLREKLAAARALWRASRIVDYHLQYDLPSGVKAEVDVRAGSEPVVAPPDAAGWTVPKLFDEVERYLHGSGVAPDVTYDANLGYVVSLGYMQGCDATIATVNAVEVTPVR
jgi:hypothetical protein